MSMIDFSTEQESDYCALIPSVTGAEVKAFRDELGLTQEQFARRYGVSLRTVRRWEQSNPSFTDSLRPLLNHLFSIRLKKGATT